MYIATCSSDFADDESKVTFVLSYLKGTPLDWFQTELSFAINHGRPTPGWFKSYPEFLSELQRLFGPRDPVTDAMNSLENLRYKDSGKATRYTLEFNRHSRRTGWNEQALTRQYYRGLPDRLKDEIARIGKPAGLRTLQELVATLDQRYWERQSEISRDKRSASANTSSSSKKDSEKTSGARSDDHSAHPSGEGSKSGASNQSKKKDKKPGNGGASTSSPAASSSSSAPKTNPIADLLGPDGKLKPEERQRRMDKNLCLRCGKGGHKASDCPPPGEARSKGRAATVTAAPAAATPAPASAGKG